MTTKLGPLELKNPVLTSSGTFGAGEEYADFCDVSLLGAIVTKAVTLRARCGNPPPRIVETPSGVLNAIGLENPGVDAFIKEKMPFLRGLDTVVIVNVAGEDSAEYAEVAAKLSACGGVDAIELNISCPNVKKGGIAFGTDPGLAAELTALVRKETSLPLIVKLSPNVTDITEIAKAVAGAGADILSLVNTFRGMAIDVNAMRPALGNLNGGLSGPAIRPMALYCVYQVAGAVSLPIIGMGGIMEAKHAIEFMLCGASAVSLGTANFIDPSAALKAVDGIRKHCGDNGIANPSWLVGRARGAV